MTRAELEQKIRRRLNDTLARRWPNDEGETTSTAIYEAAQDELNVLVSLPSLSPDLLVRQMTRSSALTIDSDGTVSDFLDGFLRILSGTLGPYRLEGILPAGSFGERFSRTTMPTSGEPYLALEGGRLLVLPRNAHWANDSLYLDYISTSATPETVHPLLERPLVLGAAAALAFDLEQDNLGDILLNRRRLALMEIGVLRMEAEARKPKQ